MRTEIMVSQLAKSRFSSNNLGSPKSKLLITSPTPIKRPRDEDDTIGRGQKRKRDGFRIHLSKRKKRVKAEVGYLTDLMERLSINDESVGTSFDLAKKSLNEGSEIERECCQQSDMLGLMVWKEKVAEEDKELRRGSHKQESDGEDSDDDNIIVII